MIWVDFTILGLLSVFPIIGLIRGFNKVGYSLFFWVLALGVSLNFSREFSTLLVSSIKDSSLRILASFVALLTITLLLGGSISLILGTALRNTHISILNRIGGLILGVIHGFIVVLTLVVMVGLTDLPKEIWWQESTWLPIFQHFAILLRDHISSGITENINYK